MSFSIPHTLLAEMILQGDSLLLCDVRDPKLFSQNRIMSSVSFSLSRILLRRLKNTECPKFDEILLANKDDFAGRHSGCNIVIYNQDGSDSDDTTRILAKCLATEGLAPLYLEGGFDTFSRMQPQLCENLACMPIVIPTFFAPMCESDNPFDAPPSEITEFLMMSGERHAQDINFIKSNHITHVLNLTQTPFNPDVEAAVNCRRICLADNTSQDILAVIPEAISFIEEAKQLSGRVLVHCFAGVSRSAAIAIAYFIHNNSMTVDEAYEFIRKRRPCISPNLNFMGQLSAYQAMISEMRLAYSLSSTSSYELVVVCGESDAASDSSHSSTSQHTNYAESPTTCEPVCVN